jgi:hypothetical protein
LPNPEQLARQRIDGLLTDAGWVLQDRENLDRNAALGTAQTRLARFRPEGRRHRPAT